MSPLSFRGSKVTNQELWEKNRFSLTQSLPPNFMLPYFLTMYQLAANIWPVLKLSAFTFSMTNLLNFSFMLWWYEEIFSTDNIASFWYFHAPSITFSYLKKGRTIVSITVYIYTYINIVFYIFLVCFSFWKYI